MSISDESAPGIVTSPVAMTLRLEAGVVLVLAVLAYRALHGSGWLFAALCLAPDLSMLGYFAGKRIGAAAYNFGHSYLTPAAVALVGVLLQSNLPYLLAAIWFAHIGFDRLLGYGLKYPQGFGVTHLGLKGRKPRTQSS
ncbi:MAG: DUF4260 domain-containing protein [Caulobacteraceae bacterium]